MRSDRKTARRSRRFKRRTDERGRGVRRRHRPAVAIFSVLAGFGMLILATVSGAIRPDAEPVEQERQQATAVGPAPTSSDGERADGDDPSGPVVRLSVGRGARGSVIFRRKDAVGPRPTTIFLHGWGIRNPDSYGSWLRHLAASGETVIFPRYQGPDLGSPAEALDRTMSGIRRALRRAPSDGDVIVAGHSAGAALAADYAASAAERGLPAALAVFSVFPGRAILGYPGGIPAVDGRRIPTRTRLLVMAGTRDSVVGLQPARALLSSASRVPNRRRNLVVVRRPGVADHYAPTRSGPAVRRTFWARLDRLTARARK